MLIDTGANATIVHPDVLGTTKLKLRKTNIGLRSASNDVIPVRGTALLTISIGTFEFRHPIFVASIPGKFILGLDFLARYDGIVSCQRKILTLQNEDFILGQEEQVNQTLYTVMSTIIPAKSECMVQVKTRRGSKHVIGVITSGPKNRLPTGVLIARTLTKFHREKTWIRIMNLQETPVTLQRNLSIAAVETIESARTMSFEDITPQVVSNNEVPQHLAEMCDKSSGNLDEIQKLSMKQLLKDFPEVFSKGPDDFGKTTLVHHNIDVGDSRPLKMPPRRIPLAKRKVAAEMAKEMLERDIIEPSQSPWTSPVVLVRKKDGSTRFCVDFRKLNDVTKKDSFPLPRIDDTLDAIGGTSWFSTLDLYSGYWQVNIAEADREKTAFTTGTDLWQFKVLPFGLCNAPATFTRMMTQVFKTLPLDTCLVYLDDVIVPSKTFEENVIKLRRVFQCLKLANLKLKPSKCELFSRSVTFLGHVISGEGIKTDPQKTTDVQNWPTPTSVTEVRSFIGLCSYYRQFVKNFSTVAKPLFKLTEKGVKFVWTAEHTATFEALKELLCKSPTLSFPQIDQPFILDTDASNHGLGAVLSQIQGGEEKVIAYYSCTLNPAQRNYCTTRKELLAVIKGTKHFHHYLYGRRFLLRTDHAAIQWLLNFKAPEGQIARWIEWLQQYDFETKHRPGRIHGNADALSRRPCIGQQCEYCSKRETTNSEETLDIQAAVTLDFEIQRRRIREHQAQDEVLSKILEWLEEGIRPDWEQISHFGPQLKSYWALWDSLQLNNDVIYQCWESTDGKDTSLRLIVPTSLVSEVLRQAHDSSSGGHLGINKTAAKVKSRFYWIGMLADVQQWCRKCDICASKKGPSSRNKGPLQTYNVGAPFERVAVDILGPLPVSSSGNKYVLVFADYFTKWPEAIPVPDQKAETVAEALITNVVSRFGVPLEIHSDQGRNFIAEVFHKMWEILGTNQTQTTALHPQSDGMVERFNRTILHYLSKFVDANQRNWDSLLPLFLLSYRSATHQTTGQTPAVMMLGRELRLPVDLMFGQPPNSTATVPEYIDNLRERMNIIHEFARKNLKIESAKMKTRYDARSSHRRYEEGDHVWLYNPKKKKGLSPKLQSDWDGPYLVLRRINDVVYRIRRIGKKKSKVVHSDRLAKYYGVVPEEKATGAVASKTGRMLRIFTKTTHTQTSS